MLKSQNLKHQYIIKINKKWFKYILGPYKYTTFRFSTYKFSRFSGAKNIFKPKKKNSLQNFKVEDLYYAHGND